MHNIYGYMREKEVGENYDEYHSMFLGEPDPDKTKQENREDAIEGIADQMVQARRPTKMAGRLYAAILRSGASEGAS